MKIMWFLVVMVGVSVAMVSCAQKKPLYHDANPRQAKILEQLEKKLQSYNLQITYHDNHFHLQLISGFELVCYTYSPPFFDKKRAEEFMVNIAHEIIKTIEAPENRLYLREFPINRRYTTLTVCFIDLRTGQPPASPYYCRLACDLNGDVDFYMDQKKVKI